MAKKFLTLILCALTALVGVSCGRGSAGVSVDILTQKEMPKDKQNITVLVKFGFSINAFERELEQKFPGINLIQVGNYAPNMGITEYESRIKNGDLTDIVMTWPLDVGKEYWQERLLNLATLPVSRRYNNKVLNEIADGQNGKLYYLPGPSQVRGIVYNKTMFEENNWSVPKDFDEFVDLCVTIERSGMRSLQLSLKNTEVLDTAFVGYGFAQSFATPKSLKALADFDAGLVKFADNFMPALQNFQTLIDAGILRASDLSVRYPDREAMFFSRKCAMIEDSTLMARKASASAPGDEFALMPFFNPATPSDWARLQSVCFIGVDKRVKNDSKKYDTVMKILDYISTPEGQAALAADTGGMFSNLKDVPAPDVVELKDMRATLNGGRYGVFPELKYAQSALRDSLTGMIKGELTAEQAAADVDRKNVAPPKAPDPLPIGRATSDFSIMETGAFVADTMRNFTGADIALILDNGKDGRYNGKGIGAKFYRGNVTAEDLTRVLPALLYGEKGELWKVTMTGENLIRTLEYSIPVDKSQLGWFYYFSGLKVEYSPSRVPGTRIRKITTSSGAEIVPTQIYSVAVMDASVPEEYLITSENSRKLLKEVVSSAISLQGEISPKKDSRFILW